MRRVLHLINTAGPGGAETVYLSLARGLDPSRWRSFTVVPEVDWLTNELRASGFEPIIDAARHRLDGGYFRRMARLIRRESIDVIHSHLFGPTVEASILGLLTGVPVVGTIHGKGDVLPNERLRGVKFGLIRRGASRVVFVSDSLRQAFLVDDPIPLSATRVIANGVDPARHSGFPEEEVLRELGIRPDSFVVGAVGNLRPVKRYDVLLQAAAILRRRSPAYEFVIVGQAPPQLHGELLALRDSLGLQDAVRFTGFRPDVERLMGAFATFVISSDSEGFSIATVQAMATGLPIVATRCGGPEEILDDGVTGVLVNTASPQELADAIDRLRAQPARRAALGAEARRKAATDFSLDAQVHSYSELYEEVIEASRRGRGRPASNPSAPPTSVGEFAEVLTTRS